MKVLLKGDARLEQPCAPFDFSGQGLAHAASLARDLEEHMVRVRAAGLAAPQVGVPLRVFSIMQAGRPITCFNPEIVQTQGAVTGPEGCLSFPGLFPVVKRAAAVVTRFWLSSGQERPPLILQGLEARAFQHELDHLDGILLDKRASAQAMMNARARAKS